jgi:hypothetical protein
MSSITSGIGQMSDLQSQIWQMYNKINNATINSASQQSSESVEFNGVSSQDFVKALEEQLQKQSEQVLNNEANLMQSEQLGMPSSLSISEVGVENNSYQDVINSLMNSMAENNSENSNQQQPNVSDIETTGVLATNHAGISFKSQASNFIQKLIDSYKDKGSIIGLNV